MVEDASDDVEDLNPDALENAEVSAAPNAAPAAAEPGINRRQYKRAAMNRGVRIYLSDGSNVNAKIINISVAGVGIVYDMPAEMGAKLGLEFSLIGDNKDTVTLRVHAMVRHNHLKDNRYYIGMQFLDLDENSRDLIEMFVKERSVHNLSIIK